MVIGPHKTKATAKAEADAKRQATKRPARDEAPATEAAPGPEATTDSPVAPAAAKEAKKEKDTTDA